MQFLLLFFRMSQENDNNIVDAENKCIYSYINYFLFCQCTHELKQKKQKSAITEAEVKKYETLILILYYTLI